jgi:hypothetical protein
MSRTKHPQEKKRMELARDHRVFTENKRMFRKGWKVRKRKANHAERKQANDALRSADRNPEAADDSPSLHERRPRTIKKFAVTTLEQALEMRGARRGERFATFSYKSKAFRRK